MDYLRIKGYFQEVVCRDSREPVFESKQKMLQHLLKASVISPETALYVGDMPEDVEAAEACQIRFALASYGFGHLIAEQVHPVHCQLKSISQLGDLLSRQPF